MGCPISRALHATTTWLADAEVLLYHGIGCALMTAGFICMHADAAYQYALGCMRLRMDQPPTRLG
jgi:hypothetical protein